MGGSSTRLVVMAAGEGRRMRPLTVNRPKVMVPVAGRPMLEHLLRNAAKAGFKEAVLIVHHQAARVEGHFGDGAALGLKVSYVAQGAPRGTGHAVAALKGHVDEDFVLGSGDAYLSAEDLKALRLAKSHAVGGARVADARPYGLLKVEAGRVRGIQEKPKAATSGVVNAGFYRLPEEAVAVASRLKASSRGELELTDAISSMAASGTDFRLVELSSWMEAGRPWDLLALQATLMKVLETRIDGTVDKGVVVDGPLIVEKGARVRGGTHIEGPVFIGRDARVGPNAFLRGATSIGAGCHVGAGVEIKNSILFERANVPHLSYVGDSVLGSDVNLGAGTQVANLKVSGRNVRVRLEDGSLVDTGLRKLGLVAGDGVKTGVNSSTNPGTVLGNGVLVGAGRVADGWVSDGTRLV